MEHATHALVVITLLQLCGAEISDIIPGTWFSANTINDGYSPKPIADLFSSEPPGFSPTKPIIVLPSSPPQPEPVVTHLSTSSPIFFPSTTIAPPTSYTEISTPFSSTRTTVSHPSSYDTFSTPFTSIQPKPIPSSSPLPEFEAVTTFPPPENLPIFNFPNPQQPVNPLTTLSDTTRQGKTQSVFEVTRTTQTIAPTVIPLTQTTPDPNFFVIYENTPTITSRLPQTTRTTLRFPAAVRPLPPVTPSMDTITPYITNGYSNATSRPRITFRSTPPTPSTFITQSTTDPSSNLVIAKNPTDPRVPLIIPGPPKGQFVPNLKIRIVAPQGSITNVKINPSTTTKRPTTKKPKKKRQNTHEVCVDNCKGKREHICAVPLGTLIVEPILLKGFPSICHMACHNSFKKDLFEKIIDGRCSRIRTRIIRVDSNTKMHREELKKSEYSIINTGPRAVVELAASGSAINPRKIAPSPKQPIS